MWNSSLLEFLARHAKSEFAVEVYGMCLRIQTDLVHPAILCFLQHLSEKATTDPFFSPCLEYGHTPDRAILQ